MKEKSQVEDIDRSIYDFKDDEKDAYRIKAGLTPEIVQKLSKENMILHGWNFFVCILFKFTMRWQCRIGGHL